MKRVKTGLSCLSLLVFLAFASPGYSQQTFQTTKESVIGLLQYLPKDYNSNSNKYPLVIFLHGTGERGANSTNPATLEGTVYSVDNLGPPRFAKDGQNFPFILISPQLKKGIGNWPTWYVLEVINWAKSTLRVDEKRIHITGLSLGGGGAWTIAQEQPHLFASLAPVCGGYNSTGKACGIAKENLPVWAFHGDADPTVSLSKSSSMVNAINACSPTPNPKAKLTIYPGVKHNAWDRAYKPDHTYHNPNVFEWMMSKVNTKNGSNVLPTASAGSDKSYSNTTKITLSGSGSDSDGSVKSYRWTKISGPSATIANASSASTSVTASPGTYMFRLTVTDNDGGTDSDYVKVTVTSSSTGKTSDNASPTANAGSDVNLVLPATTANLNGSGKDSDGSISSYTWTKVSGGVANLSGANTAKLIAWGLKEGSYVFRLTVKDNDGATASDDVKVVVSKSGSTSGSNSAPVASAGSDVTLSLPSTTAVLKGSGKDTDGSIASYTWTKISGGAANLSGANTSTLTAWKLVQGTYVFRLTVKDNKGATDYDDVKVVVNGTSSGPSVNAGSDISLKLPATTARMYGKTSGTIKSYQWSKLSGPQASLSGATTPDLIAYKLVAGTYVFRLTVKDSSGKSAYDDVKVVVAK